VTSARVASADGTRIAVETVGEGPPLVLTTGALQDRASVRLLAQALADRATVHLWDRRGRGDSGGVPDPSRDPAGPDGDALVAAEVAEVVECHRTTGDDCFVATVRLRSLDDLEGVLDRFGLHGQTTTAIIHSTPVPPRGVPLG
jgi:pimeloyl-ACP methyl ester carboxylesterase